MRIEQLKYNSKETEEVEESNDDYEVPSEEPLEQVDNVDQETRYAID